MGMGEQPGSEGNDAPNFTRTCSSRKQALLCSLIQDTYHPITPYHHAGLRWTSSAARRSAQRLDTSTPTPRPTPVASHSRRRRGIAAAKPLAFTDQSNNFGPRLGFAGSPPSQLWCAAGWLLLWPSAQWSAARGLTAMDTHHESWNATCFTRQEWHTYTTQPAKRQRNGGPGQAHGSLLIDNRSGVLFAHHSPRVLPTLGTD